MVIAHEFDYRRPASLEEAIGILSEYPGSARLLAGGTDLVAWLRDDVVAPDMLIDIKDVPGSYKLLCARCFPTLREARKQAWHAAAGNLR